MEETQRTGFIRHLPNIVSLIRIIGALALPFLMSESWGFDFTLPWLGELPSVPGIWIIAFLILVFSDKVDGTLARRLNAVSDLGSILDAIGDALLLLVGVLCCIMGFARENISDVLFWFYIIIVVSLLVEKYLTFAVSKKYFGEGNMLHSYPHKAFAAVAYVFIPCWAFTHALPAWSLVLLWLMMTYAVIDEIVYTIRTAEYDFDFKGHGFEKYPLREKR